MKTNITQEQFNALMVKLEKHKHWVETSPKVNRNKDGSASWNSLDMPSNIKDRKSVV